MASNILAGEKRWASARRTGMTVLGKVAVPKPLNLPSQRLENHGLNPNVEIVPKGSIGWGSRPSSSASNPWGSASHSPNADGGASSPGHLSGRPSSSGSRPSTAGSERTHERGGNAWGQSSRPSSASGASASNQTSLTLLRPHSAETRPGSSQLSRFAEPLSDSSAARGPIETTERVGFTSFSDNERFSLISGDFPTLNSSRDSSVKNFDSRVTDQGSNSRPSSASGRVGQKMEKVEPSQADAKSGTVNTWRRDGHPSGDNGNQPNMEKWHGEPQQYHNANIPPPQFDAWHGPPMNAPAGVWYRGPPAGPPYGAPVPGGFPVEPFPYYCPQMPPAHLANSQPVPMPGTGPRGHRPENGELYRPQMPDAFVRPGMPFRPGFYHGPMPFEGYYGPPMGYCNPNEREVPFKGMAAGPSYTRYPAPNASDSGHSHARVGKGGSTGKRLSEPVEAAHSDDARGEYRVILKQNNEWDVKDEGENREDMPTSNLTHAKKRGQPGMSLRTTEWGADPSSDDEMYPMSVTQVGNSSSTTSDRAVYDLDTNKVKSFESVGNVAVEDNWIKKSETRTSSSPGMSQASSAGERGSTLPATARDSTLMQKIEGLNEKVRSSDFRSDGIYTSQREEQKSRSHSVNIKVANSLSQAGNVGVSHEKLPATGITSSVIHETIVPVGDKSSQWTSVPRRPSEGVRGKSDDNVKRMFNSPDGDGWQKKPVASVAPSVHAANVGSAPNVQESRLSAPAEDVENPSVKDEGQSLTEAFDSTDSQAQRAKRRELAKQRAIQLQKEEEERTKEQKAKALAKLEELNRRTLGGNALNMKTVSQQEQEGPQTLVESITAGDNQVLSPSSASTADVVTHVSENTGEWGGEAIDLASHLQVETSNTALLGSVDLPTQSLPVEQEMHNAGEPKAAPQRNEAGASRHKRSGYRPKQTAPSQTNVIEKSVAISASKAPKDPIEVAGNAIGVVAPDEVGSSGEFNLPNILNVVADSSAQQKRKSNRSSKNKHRVDDAPSVSALPSAAPDESNPVEVSGENERSKATKSDQDCVSFQAAIDGGGEPESSEQYFPFHNDGAHGRVSHHRKPQQSRRFARNLQNNRFADKHHGSDNVMWAPVRSQNKMEPTTETSQKIVQESAISTESDNQGQSYLNIKRAEIERYIPKPVAKELAQQGNIQLSISSSVGLSTPCRTAEKAEPELKSTGNLQSGSPEVGNAATTSEFRCGDSKLDKQPKAHGAWRQRGSVESLHVKGTQNGSSSSTSNPTKSVQLPVSQNQSVKPELTSTKSVRQGPKELNASDVTNVLNDSDATGPVISAHGRDQGVMGKGKWHAVKGDRSMGNHHELEKNLNSRDTDRNRIQTGESSVNQTEKNAASKENKGFEERTSSHWQPKSLSFSNSNSQRGNRVIVGQSLTGDVSGVVKKGHISQPQGHVSLHVNHGSGIDCTQLDSGSGNDIHQGHRKERKLSSSKGRPYSPNEGSVGADESIPNVSADAQNKQHFSSDIRRNRNQHNRTGTSHESRGDWNQERRRQNVHYEYQPVGPNNEREAEKFEDGSHSMGPRYKDRFQSNSKRGRGSFRGRGNFHGQQSGNVRIDAGYG